MSNKINSYDLSRRFWNFCFDNPEKVRPNHSAIYFFAIEHCNRLGWKEKFGFPTTMAMEATGIKSYNTYINHLNDLVEWGFIKMIEKSKNQFSSNIVALSNFDKARDESLDKAFIKHASKQVESDCSVYKLLNNKTIKLINNNASLVNSNLQKWIDAESESLEGSNKEEIKQSFETFWNLYDKKVDRKKSLEKWGNLKQSERDEIIQKTPAYVRANPDPQFRKNPVTFFNNCSWEDEIIKEVTKRKPSVIEQETEKIKKALQYSAGFE